MDFLTCALFSKEDELAEKLVGAIITRFDPDDVTSRAIQRYISVEDMRKPNMLKPSGFLMKDNEVLLSDTTARRAMASDLTEYIENELKCTGGLPKPGLIDFVLLGAKTGSRILPLSDKDGAVDEGAISMSNLKVSNSSFNIYAPYRDSDGQFYTCSLMDIETNTPRRFTAAIDLASANSFHKFLPWMRERPDMELSGYRIYDVEIPLLAYPAFTGEAFCNYLAYNVAYCKIGLQVINAFVRESMYKPEQDEPAVKPRVTADRKVPLYNLYIEAPYKHEKVQSILNCDNDTAELKALVSRDEEAFMTFSWLQHIFRAPQVYANMQDNVSMEAASLNLQLDCKLQYLHFACELLAQRLYLHGLGQFDTSLGEALKGGGVNGISFKRFVR